MTFVYRKSAFLDGHYRYWLKRVVGTGKRLIVWVMLNPSTADHVKDDATIKRVMRFSKDWGFDIVIVVNVFAYRHRSPKVMKAFLVEHGWEATVGEQNPFWVNYWTKRADRLVIGWGNNMTFEPVELMRTFRGAACLGLTKSLQPKHPLMIAADTAPVLYEIAYSEAVKNGNS